MIGIVPCVHGSGESFSSHGAVICFEGQPEELSTSVSPEMSVVLCLEPIIDSLNTADRKRFTVAVCSLVGLIEATCALRTWTAVAGSTRNTPARYSILTAGSVSF